MTVPQIALNLRITDFNELVALGNDVIANMTGNGNFTTPQVPLIDLEAAVTDVQNALAAWGDLHHRGSQSDYANLKAKAATLHTLLKTEAGYVQGTAAVAANGNYAEMAAIIRTSGFGLKSQPQQQGMLEVVQNLQATFPATLNRNQVKLEWDKPNGITSPNNVKSYEVYRSATTVFADAVQIATISKTTYVDSNNTLATVTWSYFIVPVGAAGPGPASMPITVTLLS